MLVRLGLLLLLTIAVAAPAAAATTAVAALEERTLQAANAARVQQGLSPLAARPALNRIAREHSRRMAERGQLAHELPDGPGFAARIRGSGLSYRRAAENIAMNLGTGDPAATAVEGWLQSPGHRRNLLDPDYGLTGIGVWTRDGRYYFTQVFLATPESP